jgi:hypothetical protein
MSCAMSWPKNGQPAATAALRVLEAAVAGRVALPQGRYQIGIHG